MSIKRSSKTMGTVTRKPAASPAARHVEVMAPRQMVPGDTYSGWLCKNKPCGRVIAIAIPPGAGKSSAAEVDDQVVIKCPHCADENLYRWSYRAEHKYAAPGAG